MNEDFEFSKQINSLGDEYWSARLRRSWVTRLLGKTLNESLGAR
jgi:hypothetical protein